MKKITLTTLFSFSIFMLFAQTYSTGIVALDTDYSVQFDVNTSTNTVTMTLVGPNDIWLGVGPGISTGLGMGNLGDDAVVYNSSGLQDRNMPSGTGMPNLDSSQDWSVSSDIDNTSTGIRTLVATRAINTGDSNDYIFPSTATSMPILWAKGSSLTFGYHGSNKSGTVANLTLGADDFAISNFKMYPNPVSSNLNIKLLNNIQKANVSIYNTLGTQVYIGNLSNLNSSINISNLSNGMYLLKLTTQESIQTERFIKQ